MAINYDKLKLEALKVKGNLATVVASSTVAPPVDVAAQKTLVNMLSQNAAAINAKTTIVPVPVDAEKVKQYLMEQGVLAHAGLVAQDTTLGGSPARVAAQTIRDILFNNIYPSFDFSGFSPASMFVLNILTDLVVGGVMTGNQRDELVAMGQETVPLWTTFSHRELDYADILVATGVKVEDISVPNDPLAPEFVPILPKVDQ